MSIIFEPLQVTHFDMLLNWLSEPHVKNWYDKDVVYTPHLIEEKFGSYVHRFKIEKGIKKHIKSFVIYLYNNPIGYCQSYNAYDFDRDNNILLNNYKDDFGFPNMLGSFDIFIGDKNYIGKGFGKQIIDLFLAQHIWNKYDACFIDVENTNERALGAYKRCGFQEINQIDDLIWLIKTK